MPKTNDELERLAATAVMGWPNVEETLYADYDGPFPAYCDGDLLTSPLKGHAWHPLTDWRSAGEIVDKMRADGWLAVFDWYGEHWDAQYFKPGFEVDDEFTDGPSFDYRDKFFSRAITIAALLAKQLITKADLEDSHGK